MPVGFPFQGAQHLVAATHGRGMYRVRVMTNIFVDVANNSGIEDGSSANPYNTVSEGIAETGNGKDLFIRPAPGRDDSFSPDSQPTLGEVVGEQPY